MLIVTDAGSTFTVEVAVELWKFESPETKEATMLVVPAAGRGPLQGAETVVKVVVVGEAGWVMTPTVTGPQSTVVDMVGVKKLRLTVPVGAVGPVTVGIIAE